MSPIMHGAESGSGSGHQSGSESGNRSGSGSGTGGGIPSTPGRRAQQESRRRGDRAFASSCADLLTDRVLDPALVETLGGAPGRGLVDAGFPEDQRYWIRVWAARGLLWAWHDCATDAVLGALGDEHWRVREMALKVVGRHLDAAAAQPFIRALTDDPTARVRTQASRISALLPPAMD